MEQVTSALVVIDMQEDYIGEKSKYGLFSQQLIEKINKRIASAEEAGEMVIYVKNKGMRKKEVYVSDFVQELSIVSNYIIEKGKPSVFESNTFLDMLRDNGILQIELIGIDGNSCVAFSAIDASRSGFSVIFPLEYIGIHNNERFIKTREKLLKANVKIVEFSGEYV